MEQNKGIGFFGLIGLVISSCIGSGVFAITGQLAAVSSPGATLIAWVVVGIGFLALAFSLNNLGAKRPDLKGIFQYAEEGFGPLAGFISGWGYWLSAWLGNVAFATMMMSTLGYFFPVFRSGNSLACVVAASIFMWLLICLCLRGIESASFLNAIVMVCKVGVLVVFLAFCIALFKADVFTADFWGTVSGNIAAASTSTAGFDLMSVAKQVISCMIVMMWVFIGIEGATVMSSRAKKSSDVGKATVVGLICLLLIYIGASVLPYGFMSYTEVAGLDYPALLYVFDAMAPGWGGTFISIAIIITIAGAWLSFMMLPAETSAEMATRDLLPASWGTYNAHGAPQLSLIIVAACIQVFLFVCMLSGDAYNFAFSLCTVSIVFTWGSIALYQMKFSLERKESLQFIVGLAAVAFQVVAVLFNGWSYLLLTCVGYIPGFIIYIKVRKGLEHDIARGEWLGMALVSILGVISLVLLFMGVIAI